MSELLQAFFHRGIPSGFSAPSLKPVVVPFVRKRRRIFPTSSSDTTSIFPFTPPHAPKGTLFLFGNRAFFFFPSARPPPPLSFYPVNSVVSALSTQKSKESFPDETSSFQILQLPPTPLGTAHLALLPKMKQMLREWLDAPPPFYAPSFSKYASAPVFFRLSTNNLSETLLACPSMLLRMHRSAPSPLFHP